MPEKLKGEFLKLEAFKASSQKRASNHKPGPIPKLEYKLGPNESEENVIKLLCEGVGTRFIRRMDEYKKQLNGRSYVRNGVLIFSNPLLLLGNTAIPDKQVKEINEALKILDGWCGCFTL